MLKNSLLSDSINVVNKESAALANKNIKEDLKKQSESDKKRLYRIIGGIIIILLFIFWYLVKKYNKERKARLEKRNHPTKRLSLMI
jgi:flagellar biosynthesis/type III secretory pathway M-ring protein FliF/YscJ